MIHTYTYIFYIHIDGLSRDNSNDTLHWTSVSQVSHASQPSATVGTSIIQDYTTIHVDMVQRKIHIHDTPSDIMSDLSTNIIKTTAHNIPYHRPQ